MGWVRTYDAEYCALAELEDVPLITADDRLARGARRRLPYVLRLTDEAKRFA
jgi:predicted nucleic acid-binding protein